MANLWRKNLAIFHKVKKIEIYFPSNTFVSNICYNTEFLNQKYFSEYSKDFLNGKNKT